MSDKPDWGRVRSLIDVTHDAWRITETNVNLEGPARRLLRRRHHRTGAYRRVDGESIDDEGDR